MTRSEGSFSRPKQLTQAPHGAKMVSLVGVVANMDIGRFYHDVSNWPEKEQDLGFITEGIRKILGTPWAWLDLFRVGTRSSGQIPGDTLEELKRQIQQNPVPQISDEDPHQIQKIRLKPTASAGSRWVYWVPVFSEQRTEHISPEEGTSPHHGWLAAGSEHELSHDQEISLVAVAQYLADLALVDRFRLTLAMRDQFLSIASHELKTPLTSIYGILQLQERMLTQKRGNLGDHGSSDQERQLSFFRIVIRQVERLNELIDGLLDVSRIHVGRFMVEPTESDAALLLKDTIEGRLSNIAREAGVQIQVDAPSAMNAWIDPVRFEEVVTNLCMNAIRFSPEGGFIWVRLWEDGENLFLTVRDQGPSVPDEDRSRLFRPFERAQRTSRFGGLGLGLFISRQIAQLHGGTVSLAESVPGKGNLLEARFPLQMAKQKSA